MRWRNVYGAGLLVALAAAVGFAPAADLTVLENPVAGTSFAEVRLPLGKGDSIIWEVSPDPTKVKEYTVDGSAVLHFNGPAGTYLVTAFVVNFDAKKFTKKKQTVVIGTQPQPPPVPPIPPVPPTPPEPTGTPKKFVVVEETAAAGAWRGDVLGSAKVASWYKAAGMSHRLIDVNTPSEDPAANAYQKLAAGKHLPYLWVLDDAGKLLKELPCPTDPDKFVAAFEMHQGPRALGCILAKPKLKWAKFGESPTTPLIPRDKWKPIDLSGFLPPVYDQDGIGQCASSSACSVYEWARNLAGLPPVHVSAGDLYSRVNGGQDQGSMPEDNLKELIDNGVTTASAVPYIWNGRRPLNDAATVAARRQHRISEAYLCDSFDALASALQQGFATQIAIWWYDSYTPDAEGVLPPGRGGKGGHALMAYGLVKLPDGRWALLVRNSWGTGWGNSRDGKLGAGNCVIPESAFSWEFGSVWAVRAVYQTQSNFPVPKASFAEPNRERVNPFDRELLVLKP